MKDVQPKYWLSGEYPSGMHVNSLLAAKNFNVHEENIIVGNGAAELIKSLMNRLKGKTGFIRPTFEEYPNRYSIEDHVDFVPDNRDYSYSADDIMAFFAGKQIFGHLIGIKSPVCTRSVRTVVQFDIRKINTDLTE